MRGLKKPLERGFEKSVGCINPKPPYSQPSLGLSLNVSTCRASVQHTRASRVAGVSDVPLKFSVATLKGFFHLVALCKIKLE